MPEKYLINCENCKKKTIHIITKVNVRRGVKLFCLSCFKEKKKFHNFQDIKSKEILENEAV